MNGRLTVIVNDDGIINAVGNPPCLTLMIKHDHELIPGLRRIMICQCQGVKAVIPAPDIAHPVLRHKHGVSFQEAKLIHDTAPVYICRLFPGIFVFFRHRGHGLIKTIEIFPRISAYFLYIIADIAVYPGIPDFLQNQQEFPVFLQDIKLAEFRIAHLPFLVKRNPSGLVKQHISHVILKAVCQIPGILS